MAKNRSTEVDIIRMAALIGICVVNVPFMALPDGGLLHARGSRPCCFIFCNLFFRA